MCWLWVLQQYYISALVCAIKFLFIGYNTAQVLYLIYKPRIRYSTRARVITNIFPMKPHIKAIPYTCVLSMRTTFLQPRCTLSNSVGAMDKENKQPNKKQRLSLSLKKDRFKPDKLNEMAKPSFCGEKHQTKQYG